jgi:hypothetical protein
VGLRKTVLQAVDQAVKAIGDLAVPAVHTSRVATVYTPGGATVYTLTNYEITVVLTSFEQKEIEEDREAASDVKILVFHEKAVPQLNDTITVNGKQYRVMRRKPTYAGSEIAFSTVQARPLSA